MRSGLLQRMDMPRTGGVDAFGVLVPAGQLQQSAAQFIETGTGLGRQPQLRRAHRGAA